MTSGATFSIVIETDNLQAADEGGIRECLDSLAGQQPMLARAEGVFLLDGGQLGPALGQALRRAYPWLTVTPAGGTSYIGLKARGSLLSASEVVVFCDADLRYERGWLEAMVSPFHDPAIEAVAGETSTALGGPYGLAIALTFLFPRFTGETALAPTPVYWANNIAVRRTVLERFPLPDPSALYRGQNILHSHALARAGVAIWRQPRARGVHTSPRRRAVLRRYRMLGRDAATLGRLTREPSGVPFLPAIAPDEGGRRPLRKLWGRVGQVARAQPLQLAWLPLALPFVLLLGACYLAGGMPAAAPRALPRPAPRAR